MVSKYPVVLRGFENNHVFFSFEGDDRIFAITPLDFYYLGLQIVRVDWMEAKET